MILNHMICPTCGHDCYTECSYVTCAACQTLYYASSSRTCQPGGKQITWTFKDGIVSVGK